MNRSESITKIAAALNAAQKTMGNAAKGSTNPFFKSKYADLNAIREACIPELNAQGVTVLQPTTVFDGKPYVETTLLHESGEFLSSLTEIVANKQNDAQAHGSGVSYARRYGLQSFLCIGAEDDDGEKAHGRGTAKSSPASSATTTVKIENDTPTVVKTNLVNGESVNILSNGQAEPPLPKKGFGVKTPAKPATEDGWT